jgi:hypothetical protein
MPFSPSDFEWWMWALFAAGAFVVAFVFYLITVACADKRTGISILFGFMTFAVGIAGIGCAAVALIRFVKWVWG